MAKPKALVTSGPTYEPIDPVRFIGNRSSGKQGYAIAEALRDAGFDVTLVTGPVALNDPKGVKMVRVQTAVEMLAACEKALPADVAVFAAAVSDWRVKKVAGKKLKKTGAAPKLALVENPDILATIAKRKSKRPTLVIGFAAETNNVLANAKKKLKNKSCDWILANDVSNGKGLEAEENQVTIMAPEYQEIWPKMSKVNVAKKLVEKILNTL